MQTAPEIVGMDPAFDDLRPMPLHRLREVIEGPALNITVTDDELTVTVLADGSDYNTGLLEEHLNTFLEGKAG